MSRRKPSTYSDVQYSQLDGVNGDFVDSQFRAPPPSSIPWKAITLALLLSLGGITLLVVGSLIISGNVDSKVDK